MAVKLGWPPRKLRGFADPILPLLQIELEPVSCVRALKAKPHMAESSMYSAHYFIAIIITVIIGDV